MADLNLVDFYKDTALILVRLHGTFPRKIELYVEDIIGPDDVDEFGLHSKRHEACLGSMFWLADEGYIRYYTHIRQEAIDQVILTSKSLVLLGSIINDLPAPPEVNELPQTEALERLTMIEHIRASLKEESSARITQVMRKFFS